MEVVGQLKVQRRVHDFAVFHLLHVLLGRERILVVVVARNARPKGNGAQVQPLAQLLAGFVEAAGQPPPAHGGHHKYLDAVERVAGRVVGAEGVVAGDLPKRVVVVKLVVRPR